ncbi:zinc ribbon domain-containing protein [Paenibacillus tarimensis]|uniref:zinc ribbon domain-containing protein n=1 Tax=Paenibacillus tarimensis TaxID=416012 RepID=UPI001F22504D|nr:zinc ribbon domain-containing protein [Paenibacillus tarimensis]MCF2945724.1 zinc ribbon domain-containing protein [Paenibacillus tarimensis]
MMQCSNCGHAGEGGNFCEKCGTKLAPGDSAAAETAAASAAPIMTNVNQGGQGGPGSTGPSVTDQLNPYLQKAKSGSKMYLNYFLNTLKNPYAVGRQMGGEQFLNGIITIVLYAVLIPLMFYVLTLGERFQPSFGNMVIKPAITYAVLMLLVATYCFAAVRLAKSPAGFKEVVARFGAFLVPFVALLIIALVFAAMKSSLLGIFLLLGFVGAIFTVPAFVVNSFNHSPGSGLDAIYGTVLTYVATFITLILMASYLIEQIVSQLPFYSYY